MSLLCPDSTPTLLGLFDLTVAPPLLFYAYIPAILVALLFSVSIYRKDGGSLRAKLLLSISLAFAAWVLALLSQWVLADVRFVLFSWQITPTLEVLIPVLSIYFTYVFLYNRDIPIVPKILLALVVCLVAATAPTSLTTTTFDLYNCEAVYGNIYTYIYLFEIIALGIVTYLCVSKYRSTQETDSAARMQAVLLGIGSALFLGIFFISNFIGEYTKTYEVNLVGPAGILAFIGFITVMIIRYGVFNVKIITTQALVVATSILIASQLFSPSSLAEELVTLATLILFFVSGYFLIRSVRYEIEAKEALRVANVRQAEVTSLITHQIRGVFNNTRAGISSILDGLFGPVPEKIQKTMQSLYHAQLVGVEEVESFLQAQRVESGTVQYSFAPLDMKQLVEECFAQQKAAAEARHLALSLSIPPATSPNSYTVLADKVYLRQVVLNLIDNAIRYTKVGSITVSLTSTNSVVTYAVTDTGSGIAESDRDKMFTKYGHGTDSRKLNPASTGLGLYIVKGIVDGHKGIIRYQSHVGVGTTFFVELSRVQ